MFNSLIGWFVGTGVGLLIGKFALKTQPLSRSRESKSSSWLWVSRLFSAFWQPSLFEVTFGPESTLLLS